MGVNDTKATHKWFLSIIAEYNYYKRWGRKLRALISVSDKSGVENFAKELVALGYEIISTGGTYSKLKEAGIAVIEANEVKIGRASCRERV